MIPRVVPAAMVLLAAFNTAQGARVQVQFHNGDRLTGDLLQADSQAIRFQPTASAFTGSVTLHWDSDQVASIHFVGNPANPVCIYLSGAPAHSRANQFSKTPLCLKAGGNISKSSPTALKLVIPGPSPASSSTRAKPLEADTYSGFVSLSTNAPPAPISSTATSESPREASPAAVPSPAVGSQNVRTIWSFNLNAPEAIQQATQSSQSFGGLAAADIYANDTEHLSIAAAGTSMHNLNLHKPAITTDLFDSTIRFSRAISDHEKRQYSLFLDGEWFFNTALGIAAERSVGAGFGTRTFYSPSENLSFKAWADVRYFNERLYTPKSSASSVRLSTVNSTTSHPTTHGSSPPALPLSPCTTTGPRGRVTAASL
jgi:hypothetical protein